MRLVLPKKENIYNTSDSDIKRFYYSSFPPISWVFKKRLKMVLDLLKPEKGGKSKNLLEIGAGSGILLPSLKLMTNSLYAGDVHDNIPFVKKLMSKEGLNNLDFRKFSITKIPFASNKFDSVVAVSVLEHIPELDKAAEELYRITNKNGALVIGIPVDNILTKLGFIFLGVGAFVAKDHCNDHKMIIEALGKRFKLVKLKRFPWIFPIYFAIKFKKIR